MQTRRWLNPSLCQTLQIAVILLYLVGAFALLFGIGDYGTAYFFVRNRSVFSSRFHALSYFAFEPLVIRNEVIHGFPQ